MGVGMGYGLRNGGVSLGMRSGYRDAVWVPGRGAGIAMGRVFGVSPAASLSALGGGGGRGRYRCDDGGATAGVGRKVTMGAGRGGAERSIAAFGSAVRAQWLQRSGRSSPAVVGGTEPPGSVCRARGSKWGN